MAGMGGAAMFDGPRSPPNTKSAIDLTRSRDVFMVISDAHDYRYLARALQVLQSRRVSSWQSLSLLAFDRSFHG